MDLVECCLLKSALFLVVPILRGDAWYHACGKHHTEHEYTVVYIGANKL
jgi:hypothetical protein